MTFTPDGDLLSAAKDAVLSRWPLSPDDGAGARELWSRPDAPTEGARRLDRTGRS